MARYHKRAIVWMRRALRVEDNQALMHAFTAADELVPVLCLRPESRYMQDTPRRRFINGSIIALDEELRRRGSRLFIITGKPEEALPALAARIGATLVTAVRVYDRPALERDRLLARSLQSVGAVFEPVQDRVLLEGNEILTQSGTPFKVFTPFRVAWFFRSTRIPPVLPGVRTLASPDRVEGAVSLSAARCFLRVSTEDAGERAAQERLRRFLRSHIKQYHRQRDFPAAERTSRLSAALAIGTISIRQVFHAVREARSRVAPVERAGHETFINELIWREFYYSILLNFPHVVDQSFREEFASLRWSTNERHFSAWCQGQTGFPLVDAGMRQLQQEGWMHNRVRMIVASFLVKDLRINWQWGEGFFLERLCDADIASNNGGWQWSAGTGTDAAPWFRIFNPVLQGKRYDPEGEYVKRYVPELRRIPARFIHSPERMPASLQRDLNCLIGKHYPQPIVNHAEASRTFKQWISTSIKR